MHRMVRVTLIKDLMKFELFVPIEDSNGYFSKIQLRVNVTTEAHKFHRCRAILNTHAVFKKVWNNEVLIHEFDDDGRFWDVQLFRDRL